MADNVDGGPYVPPKVQGGADAFIAAGAPTGDGKLKIFGGPYQPPNGARAMAAAHYGGAGVGLFLRAASPSTGRLLPRGRDRTQVDGEISRWATDIARMERVTAGQRLMFATQEFVHGLVINCGAPSNTAAGTFSVTMHSTLIDEHRTPEEARDRRAEVAALPARLAPSSAKLRLLQTACEGENPVWRFVLPLDLLPDESALTGELLDVVNDVVSAVVYPIKSWLNVDRPSVIDTAVVPMLPVPPHSSFPSGHATAAHALAVVIAALTGTAYAPLETLAHSIAEGRELVGLHTPTDSLSGAQLGKSIGTYMVNMAFGNDARYSSWRALFVKASDRWAPASAAGNAA